MKVRVPGSIVSISASGAPQVLPACSVILSVCVVVGCLVLADQRNYPATNTLGGFNSDLQPTNVKPVYNQVGSRDGNRHPLAGHDDGTSGRGFPLCHRRAASGPQNHCVFRHHGNESSYDLVLLTNSLEKKKGA